jgi:hypothetical protein
VWLVGGCAAHRYDLEDQPLSCEQANRYTYQTLELMGFTVTRVDLAAPGRRGEVAAQRRRSGEEQHVTVRIDCTAATAGISPRRDGWLSGGAEFERGFSMAFTSVARGAGDEHAASGGLQVLLRPKPGLGAKLEFDLDLAAAGVLPVQVTIDNRTTRLYTFERTDFVLIGSGGARVQPLAIDEVVRRTVAASGTAATPAAVEQRLRGRTFDADAVAAHQRVSGFMFYPLAPYVEGRAILRDAESDESEGVRVEFQ